MAGLGVNKVFRRTHDPLWQLQLGVIVVMVLQLFTDDSFLPYNKFLIVVFEAALLFVMAIVTSDGYHRVSSSRRFFGLTLIVVIAAINIFSLIFLLKALIFSHSVVISGTDLLLSGVSIYMTNIFMFALLYWEIDGGGPDRRVAGVRARDFVFPQMIHKELDPAWLPGFMDYLYLSTTNVTNFASADTVPISHRSKLLMMTQALTSLITVVLVVARAITLLQ